MRAEEKVEHRHDLFRQEAVVEQQGRWFGSVLLVPQLSHTLLTAFAALVVAAVIGLLYFGEYTRKARISGFLAPEQGLIQIVAPQPGVLIQVQAEEGLQVAAGEPLAVLSVERRSEALGSTQAEVLRQIASRRASLEAERGRQQALFRQQAEAATDRRAVIETDVANLEREIELQRERLSLARDEVTRRRGLRDRNIGIQGDLVEAEEDALDQALALQALARERTALAATLVDLDAELEQLPLREAMQLSEIDRTIAALEQELAEAEAAREIVIAAPQAGTVTALQSALGSSVGAEEPLMTLVPEGSRLQARLYGPSRTIGFVRPGQRVLLRYEAFPYQKFGQYEGVVRDVSRSTVGPPALAGEAIPLPGLVPGRPVYRVTVDLAAQTATAYGEAVPLQSGMQLESDVLIEKRRLYEWILDPLYSLTGRARA